MHVICSLVQDCVFTRCSELRSEFGEKTWRNPGLEFRFGVQKKDWPNPGSAGSKFGERNRPNPGSAGSEFGEKKGLTLVWRVRSLEKRQG